MERSGKKCQDQGL